MVFCAPQLTSRIGDNPVVRRDCYARCVAFQTLSHTSTKQPHTLVRPIRCSLWTAQPSGTSQPAASRAATGREQKSLRLHTLLQGAVPRAGACRRTASLLGNSMVHEIAISCICPARQARGTDCIRRGAHARATAACSRVTTVQRLRKGCPAPNSPSLKRESLGVTWESLRLISLHDYGVSYVPSLYLLRSPLLEHPYKSLCL